MLMMKQLSFCLLLLKGSVAERYKALTRNLEVPSSSIPPAGHTGVYSLLASLPNSLGF